MLAVVDGEGWSVGVADEGGGQVVEGGAKERHSECWEEEVAVGELSVDNQQVGEGERQVAVT